MRLDDFAEFERGTNPHIWLSNHIALQIAEFSGLDTRTKKRSADMSSVIIAAVIAAGLVYLTYYLSSADHPWFAVVSGIPAGFFVLVTITMFFTKEDVLPTETDSEEGLPTERTAKKATREC
jgi:RsiW-degrading membrane proteinase PrsW (M82 family)